MCQDKWLQIVETAMNEPWEDDPEEEREEEEEEEEGRGAGGQPSPGEPHSAAPMQRGDGLLQLGGKHFRRMKLLKVTLHR
jgi:hypothetical protein